MKVLFLDIDGVLNNDATTEKSPDGYTGIDDSLVERLAKVIKELELTIVLTSTWKDDWSDKKPDGLYLDAKFMAQGLKVTGRTFDASSSKRGSGIRDYLSNHEVESYVIVDDMDFSDFTDELLDHFVMTNPVTGLSDTDIDEIRKIIRKETNV